MILMGQPDRPTAPKRGDYQMSIIITKNADGTTHEEWNKEETMKGMSIENARAWWKNLVHNGYKRVMTP